jgi:hypothetical protein
LNSQYVFGSQSEIFVLSTFFLMFFNMKLNRTNSKKH